MIFWSEGNFMVMAQIENTHVSTIKNILADTGKIELLTVQLNNILKPMK